LIGKSGAEETSGNASDQIISVANNVPGLGRQVHVYPNEALMWASSTFIVSAFFAPSIYMAVARQFIAVVIVPWLVNQRLVLQRLQRTRKEEEHELETKWWQLQGPEKVVPHMVPKLLISLAMDTEAYDGKAPPPLLYKEMSYKDGSALEKDVRYRTIELPKEDTLAGKYYEPPLAIETWGMQQRIWRPLDSNVSKSDPQVTLDLEVTGMWRYSIMQMIKQSLQMYMQFGFSERDLDDIRDFMFRHPLHILALMQLIGFVQMALTTLAFKNDISFFRGRKDYVGLSSRTLATDTLQEIIIFLYLLDYDDISRIVLFQVGVGAAISAWKYVRVSRLQLRWKYMLPWLDQTRGDCDNSSSSEQQTEEIDAKGMRYLKIVLYPVSAAWGIYNLFHYDYKSWWSWLVSSLADFAYTFGFINMMPQIFINYKLKSVAHMPWRVLGYKFFNTFIDDVFAFFIMSDHMTKKHRYMTLRDDIVFFVFLYQRYLYKVDHTRADEFGYTYEDNTQDAALPAGAAAAASLESRKGAEDEAECCTVEAVSEGKKSSAEEAEGKEDATEDH
jgi:hypothetical protein